MRLAIALGLALLWQSGPSPLGGASAAARQMRYERALTLPAGVNGASCAVLDAEVFAHAESRSGDDLRVFRTDGEGADVETPFTLGESGAKLDEIAFASTSHVRAHEGLLSFDLAMPPRPYTTVELQLAAKDYVGIATVEGITAGSAVRKSMGQFAMFNLSSQNMGRSTALSLQESSFPVLHIELRLWKPSRGVFAGVSTAMAQGASVPPSREAQTIYTTVAETGQFSKAQRQTIAALHVPAHVPVERIAFVLDDSLGKGIGKNFLRNVTVTARPDGTADVGRVERVNGTISTVHLPLYMDAHPEAAIFRSLTIDAALAASLRTGATVAVAVDNADDAPLPIKAVRLEMRQRTLCFEAKRGSTYTLRYGDVALRAPVYITADSIEADSTTGSGTAAVAVLGPEMLNAGYQARNDVRTYSERHPELWWIALIAVVAAFGTMALHSVKHQTRKG